MYRSIRSHSSWSVLRRCTCVLHCSIRSPDSAFTLLSNCSCQIACLLPRLTLPTRPQPRSRTHHSRSSSLSSLSSSLPPSLPHSLAHSLPRTLTPSVPPSLCPSLRPSVPPSPRCFNQTAPQLRRWQSSARRRRSRPPRPRRPPTSRARPPKRPAPRSPSLRSTLPSSPPTSRRATRWRPCAPRYAPLPARPRRSDRAHAVRQPRTQCTKSSRGLRQYGWIGIQRDGKNLALDKFINGQTKGGRLRACQRVCRPYL